MRQTQESEFENLLFNSTDAFERHVLNVFHENDRIEIMHILSSRIIQVLLKEELSFHHMKNLQNFKLSLIVNILYKEIANEWIEYAQEQLTYTLDEAMSVIQRKERVLFLVRFVKAYFQKYKTLFFEVIADSFINLIESMPNAAQSNELIEEVLKSPFVKSENVVVILNYNQLYSRVKNAHNAKKIQISKIQIQISQLQDKTMIQKYELQEELLYERPLAYFDDAIMRLRNTMVSHMQTIKE